MLEIFSTSMVRSIWYIMEKHNEFPSFFLSFFLMAPNRTKSSFLMFKKINYPFGSSSCQKMIPSP